MRDEDEVGDAEVDCEGDDCWDETCPDRAWKVLGGSCQVIVFVCPSVRFKVARERLQSKWGKRYKERCEERETHLQGS